MTLVAPQPLLTRLCKRAAFSLPLPSQRQDQPAAERRDRRAAKAPRCPAGADVALISGRPVAEGQFRQQFAQAGAAEPQCPFRGGFVSMFRMGQIWQQTILSLYPEQNRQIYFREIT